MSFNEHFFLPNKFVESPCSCLAVGQNTFSPHKLIVLHSAVKRDALQHPHSNSNDLKQQNRYVDFSSTCWLPYFAHVKETMSASAKLWTNPLISTPLFFGGTPRSHTLLNSGLTFRDPTALAGLPQGVPQQHSGDQPPDVQQSGCSCAALQKKQKVKHAINFYHLSISVIVSRRIPT